MTEVRLDESDAIIVCRLAGEILDSLQWPPPATCERASRAETLDVQRRSALARAERLHEILVRVMPIAVVVLALAGCGVDVAGRGPELVDGAADVAGDALEPVDETSRTYDAGADAPSSEDALGRAIDAPDDLGDQPDRADAGELVDGAGDAPPKDAPADVAGDAQVCCVYTGETLCSPTCIECGITTICVPGLTP